MLSPDESRALSAQNRKRFAPALPDPDWQTDLAREQEAAAIEIAWVERWRREPRIAERAANAPRTAAEFVSAFEALRESGPGQSDPLFPFLAERATREQLRWFVGQEVAGEAGFDDLLALTQLSFSARAKLEMARNFWDEMGRGAERGMHGPMLGRTALELDVAPIPPLAAPTDLANLMSTFARHRRYAYHSVGALGVIELTAPTRTYFVHAGLERAGVSREGAQYFLLHSTVDLKHSRHWNDEILFPLVEAEPEVASAIFEGALMRLEAGARCFATYREHFAAEGVTFARNA